MIQSIGRGGAAWAKRELGRDRTTIAKVMKELDGAEVAIGHFHLRERKGFSAKLPQLKDDLRAIGEASNQTDPTFYTIQLYRRLTASEARRQLLEKGYPEQKIPSERSLSRMPNPLGFKPRRVAKSKPLRKRPQTDAIFDKVHEINKQADVDSGTIRLSIDTKTPVPIGDFSRGGKSRNGHKALDHDFQSEAKFTPFGTHRPDTAGKQVEGIKLLDEREIGDGHGGWVVGEERLLAGCPGHCGAGILPAASNVWRRQSHP